MPSLPIHLAHPKAPPIKCQGIKTKLVPFILSHVRWQEHSTARWIEPFLGSGVVAFNLLPQRALLADTNRHIIQFYQAIQQGTVSGATIRTHLQQEGSQLERYGAAYYYRVRERFNQQGDVRDFLFLNRSCFNGLVRFNRHGQFNVPFCHKPQRFAPAYITKIANQVDWVAQQLHQRDWKFQVASWQRVLAEARSPDFVYLDPPYIGRHTDYFNTWSQQDAEQLAIAAKSLPCGFALSMWLANQYRQNDHIDRCWNGLEVFTYRHFYHIGSRENWRGSMAEALVIKPGFAASSIASSTIIK
jgi:DNA adenine methylase